MASIKMYQKNGDAKAVAIQEKLEGTFGFLPEVFQVMGRNTALDGSTGSHVHKNRRLDISMDGMENAAASAAIFL